MKLLGRLSKDEDGEATFLIERKENLLKYTVPF